MIQDRFFARCSAGVLVSGLLLGAAGCGSGPRPNLSLSAADAPRPVAMQGESPFFDGQIVATIFISRGFERNGPAGMKGGHAKDDFEQVDLPDTTDKDYAESINKLLALQIRGSPLPPVTLRLSLANQTKQPLDVAILEVNSDLGNFAVQPDHLTLEPGKPAEPYPMNSQLGLIGDNLPVKVGLKIGDKTESQTLVIKSLFTPEGVRK
ncbi:MAG TPA: hypothetical protein VG838_06190 [Opitutaceae bacterium]|nr:hypothetical protein [Opitutaceae bacterium]